MSNNNLTLDSLAFFRKSNYRQMSLIIDIRSFGYDSAIDMLLIIISTIAVAMSLYFLIHKYAFTTNTMEYSNVSNEQRKLISLNQKKETLLQQTMKDLAMYLNVNKSDIIFVSITDKVWSDTSLNCFNGLKGTLTSVPEKKQINGWLIAYKYDGNIYEYNTSDQGQYVLCNKIEIPKNISKDYIPTSK